MKLFFEILKYVLCYAVVFLPSFLHAQYDPQGVIQQEDTVSAVTFAAIRFLSGSIMWITLIIIIYFCFKALIAGVLYITSGGDEDRTDTAFTWWKQSAIWIISMMIMYICTIYFSDVGVMVSVL